MTKLLLAVRNVANALKKHGGVILLRDPNNGKWASDWELETVRKCFMLGSPEFDPVAGCRYFGFDV